MQDNTKSKWDRKASGGFEHKITGLIKGNIFFFYLYVVDVSVAVVIAQANAHHSPPSPAPPPQKKIGKIAVLFH